MTATEMMDPEHDSNKDAQRWQISRRRKREECRGASVNGSTYETDANAQGKAAGAVVAAQLALQNSQAFEMSWSTRDGWVTLDANEMIDVGQAILGHVKACFERERELLDMIEADTYTDDMLGTGWPA